MKRKVLRSITLIAIAVIGLINLNYSSNPPIDRTNRTGSNCTGCHNGSLNPSGGSMSITGPSSYYPGKTYTITTALTGGLIYGFEITAVQASNTSTGAGSFSGTGFNTTTSGGRPYARHSSSSSTSSYGVTWTAPTTNVGSVTIYGAGVSANGDGGNSNDKTYATTKSITALNLISFTTDSSSISCVGNNDGKIILKNISGGAGGPYTYKWSGSTSTADSLVNLGPGTYTVTVTDNSSNELAKTVKLSAPSAISNRFNLSPSICQDSTGWALPNVSGGKSPYSVAWPAGISVSNDTAVNLKAGSYIITITDNNGCSINDTAVISTSGSNITFNITSNPEFCNNGWGEAFVSNIANVVGKPSFIWTNNKIASSIDSLSAGSYSVTISDGAGCSATKSIMVSAQSNKISFTTSTTDDKCNQSIGSAKVLNPVGGAAPYSYNWDNGSTLDSAIGLSKGSYSVTVTDSMQCSATQMVTIDDANSPSLSLSDKNLDCFGDSSGQIRGIVNGGTKPYSFNWSNGSSDSISDKLVANVFYTLTVTDANGCTALDSSSLTEPTALIADTLYQSTSNDSTCDESIVLAVSGGTPNYSFNWSNGATDSTLSNLCEGVYTCTITDANGCETSPSITVVDGDLTSLVEFSKNKLHLFPNPASEEINITSDSPVTSIQIVSIDGSVIKSIQSESIETVSIVDLQNGVYFMKLNNDKGASETIQFIKR